MIYITGDTHRWFERVTKLCRISESTKDDILVILGDVGINYFGGSDDQELKNYLSELPITLFCIHGNHEQRPESIGGYKETEWHNGLVYWEPDFPNLLFAKDGENIKLPRKNGLYLSGCFLYAFLF